MKFYLAGQAQFGNRGCEALTRSVVTTIREQIPDAQFLVPSTDPARDGKQWPEMSALHASFCDVNPVPPSIKWWHRAIRVAPWVKPLWEPSYKLPAAIAADVKQCDAVLMIGGDVITDDYGPGSLFIWSGFMDAVRRGGSKTMLFGASISKFKDPVIERYMVNHLKRYSLITLRESESMAYVKRLGIDGAQLVADPAFCMESDPVPLPQLFAGAPSGVLGFNMSPILEESFRKAGGTKELLDEAAEFVKRVLASTDLRIALIPHVYALDGGTYNSDVTTLEKILARVGGPSDRLAIVPRGYNAVQSKHVIGQCRFFMGGRTHSTIAAWSKGVPTISFAYSTKAYGLNRDLFGSLEYVLETPRISNETLWSAFDLLRAREGETQELLKTRVPVLSDRARLSASALRQLVSVV